MDSEVKKTTPVNSNYMTWSDENLISKAKELGLDSDLFIEDGHTNRKMLVGMIKFAELKAGKGAETLVEEDAGKENKRAKIRGLKEGEHVVRIIFHDSDENDLPYVSIGLNGKAYYIPKNREVWIPKFLLDGPIKDAVMQKMVMKVDPRDGNITYEKRPVPRFIYQVIDIV